MTRFLFLNCSSKKRLVAAICGIGRAGSIHLSNCIQNCMVKLKYLVDLDVEKIQNIKVEFYLEDVIVLQVDQFYKVLGKKYYLSFDNCL